jgi:hypothetical protein
MSAPRRFTPYPAYKDSGVEWLGEIPAHWDLRRLKSGIREVKRLRRSYSKGRWRKRKGYATIRVVISSFGGGQLDASFQTIAKSKSVRLAAFSNRGSHSRGISCCSSQVNLTFHCSGRAVRPSEFKR